MQKKNQALLQVDPQVLLVDGNKSWAHAWGQSSTVYMLERMPPRFSREMAVLGTPLHLSHEIRYFHGAIPAWNRIAAAARQSGSTCSNYLIFHIVFVLSEFIRALHLASISQPNPRPWSDNFGGTITEARRCTGAKPGFTAKIKGCQETLFSTVRAIRRSGHRGTSALNWPVNCICWACSPLERPEEARDPSGEMKFDAHLQEFWGNCQFGQVHWLGLVIWWCLLLCNWLVKCSTKKLWRGPFPK